MKTITLQGTEKVFEHLNECTEYATEELPQEIETRVYVLDTQEHLNDLAYTDEQFIEQAEQDGRVYTLQGFQEAFNLEEINSTIDVIRFISVPIS